MEPVGPRAALEPQVMTNSRMMNDECRGSLAFVILFSAFVILAPLSACGHGAEFLSAKLTLLPDAQARLEITADYGGNPLITNATAAREALLDPVRLRQGDKLVPLAELAVASLFEHQNWADYAPAAYLPTDTEETTHTLITAVWRWRCAEPELVFEMPRGKLHDVLLWTHDATNPAAPPKWMLLLAGDRSRPIPIQQTPWWRSWVAAVVGGVLLGAYLISRNFTLRQRTL